MSFLNYPGIEQVEVINKEETEDGLTIYKLKYRNLNIITTCNKPSKQAIENYNRVFNQWINKVLHDKGKETESA